MTPSSAVFLPLPPSSSFFVIRQTLTRHDEPTPTPAHHHHRQVVVIGGATLDLVTSPLSDHPFQLGTSMPGTVRQSWGGVGRNIAESFARVSGRRDAPLLLATVGGDGFGRALQQACVDLGMPVEGVVQDPLHRTAVYAASLDDRGELVTAVADMDVMDAFTVDMLQRFEASLLAAQLVVVDGNISPDTMRELIRICDLGGSRDSRDSRDRSDSGNDGPNTGCSTIPPPPLEFQLGLWFEPTSVPKAVRAVEAGLLHCSTLTFLSPNVEELRAMCGMVESGQTDENEIVALARRLIGRMRPGHSQKHIVVTRGDALGC